MSTDTEKLERAALEAFLEAVESGEYDLSDVMDERLDAACVEWPSDADHALPVATGAIKRALADAGKLAKAKAEMKERGRVAARSFRDTGSDIQYGESIALRDILHFIASLDEKGASQEGPS